MLVIGSGPGGQKAAIAAAELGRRVAVVDRPDMVGGVSIHTGTIQCFGTGATEPSTSHRR